jgi:hypothetical protein
MSKEMNVVPKQGTSESMQRESVIPFDSVPLPSKGKLYNEGSPLHLKDCVEIKAMTAEEEDILTSPALLKKGTVTNALIQACMTNKLIDPRTLLIGDKSTILLAVRISGFGADYKVKTSCPECDKQFSHVFDLSKLELKPLSAEPLRPGTNLFEFVLPRSGRKVLFSLLTDEDESEISKAQEAKKKSFAKQNITVEVDTNVTDRLIRQIQDIAGEKDGAKISSLVRKMSAYDSRALRGYIKSIEPDILMEQEVTCPLCGAIDIYSIPLGAEFLWPRF